MNGNTFNVSEFNSIYTMLEENSNRVSMKTNQIVSLCEQLSQLVQSTDSNLSSSYLKVGESLKLAKEKVVKLLAELENEMKVYASKTIQNEEQFSEDLNTINTMLEDAVSAISGVGSGRWYRWMI